MRFWIYRLGVAALITIVGCSGTEPIPPVPPNPAYAFFTAGHIYGHPYVDDVSVHPPFKEKLGLIQDHPALTFGFFTGDIVYTGNEAEWDEVDRFVAELDVPIYFTVGNHDMSNRPLYEARYGQTYYRFTYFQDMFVVLDPNLDGWSISGDQLLFLKETLEERSFDRLFVFFHQVLWWAPDNKYQKVRINSEANRAEQINFWTELMPLFRATEKPVYLYAGDMGAFDTGHEFMYDREGLIHFIGSGMGGGRRDNVVVTEVSSDGRVNLVLLALNGDDPNALGKLTDYQLPE